MFQSWIFSHKAGYYIGNFHNLRPLITAQISLSAPSLLYFMFEIIVKALNRKVTDECFIVKVNN